MQPTKMLNNPPVSNPMLHVRVCEARDLYNPQLFGRPDPYCIIMHNHRRVDTPPQRSTVNPEFNAVVHFHANIQETLTIEIWNRNTAVPDELLGCCFISITNLPRGVVLDDWVPMRHTRNCPSAVRVRLLAEGFGFEGSAMMGAQQQEVMVLRGLDHGGASAAQPGGLPPGYLLQLQTSEPVVGTVMFHPNHHTSPPPPPMNNAVMGTGPSAGDGGAFHGNGYVANGVNNNALQQSNAQQVESFVMFDRQQQQQPTDYSSTSSGSRERRPKSPTSCH